MGNYKVNDVLKFFTCKSDYILYHLEFDSESSTKALVIGFVELFVSSVLFTRFSF